MTNDKNLLNDDGVQQVSDETIRRFLLGGLSVSDQPLFEQSLFLSEGLDTRVRLAEVELADDYAYGRLTPADRKLFEENFLVTADRERELRVSDVLRQRFSTSPAGTEKKTVARKLAHLLGLDQPAWRNAFSVLILLILFGTIWMVVKEPRLAERITNKIIPRRSTSRSAPREVNHPTNVSSSEHQITPTPLPVHDLAVTSPQSLVLFPTTPDLGKIPTATLSKGEQDVLRLRLAVTADRTVPYRAEVLTIAGQSVFSVDWLPGAPFDLDVPVRLLRSGKYQVRLSDARDGLKKEVANYYFLVQ